MLEQARVKASEGGLSLLDCFNPNIQFIVEGEKEQKEIAEYTSKDGREVLIKQTMRYESKTQVNRIEWHYFKNGEFDSEKQIFVCQLALRWLAALKCATFLRQTVSNN